jgi:glycosyltransferase involved in cell wall biosynthesis
LTERPRVLFVGRVRYELPLPSWLAPKWDAIQEELDLRVLAAASNRSGGSDPRFRLDRPFRPRILDGIVFYLRLPARVRNEIRRFDPAAIVASDPIVGAASLLGRRLAGRRPAVIVEVHGDWRTFTRSYGSRGRRLLARAVDAVSAQAVRRADATRAVSTFTAQLVEDVTGVAPTSTFTAYSDLTAFTRDPLAPLPERPTVLFVGALERYKNVEGLAGAWRLLEARVPDAQLVIVGSGSQRAVVEQLRADFPDRVHHHAWLDPPGVAEALDQTSVLVLPSWPEGLGRVVIEAFARGRAVVATDGGGIPDLVTDGVEGFLVPPFDEERLAGTLERILRDPELAARLGAAAHARFDEWAASPADLARELRTLVERATAR